MLSLASRVRSFHLSHLGSDSLELRWLQISEYDQIYQCTFSTSLYAHTIAYIDGVQYVFILFIINYFNLKSI